MARRGEEEPACPICLAHLHAAVTTNCGHSFCAGCLLDLLEHGTRDTHLCPCCRAPIRSAAPSYTLRALARSGQASETITRTLDQRLAQYFGEPAAQPHGSGLFECLKLFNQPASFTTIRAWALLLVVAAYVCSPIDLIPDWHLPGLGLIDDLLLVVWLWLQLNSDWHKLQLQTRLGH